MLWSVFDSQKHIDWTKMKQKLQAFLFIISLNRQIFYLLQTALLYTNNLTSINLNLKPG